MDDAYDFSLKFDGSKHSVNSVTYVQSLVSLSTIIREVNYQLGAGKKIDINIVAENEGSFDVVLQLVDKTALGQIFNKDNLEVLSTIVITAVGLIQLKQYVFKFNADLDKTEINGDHVKIKNVKGDVVYETNKHTYNIFVGNQAVNDAISEQFKVLNDDEDITAFEVKADSTEARVEKEEFSLVAEKFVVDTTENEESSVPAKLIVLKVVFDDDRKWDFLYNGNKISAWVKDKKFWKEIHSGKSFAEGDEIVADLKIYKKYDKTIDAYVNRDYEIINVRQHYPRQYRKQLTLEELNEAPEVDD